MGNSKSSQESEYIAFFFNSDKNFYEEVIKKIVKVNTKCTDIRKFLDTRKNIIVNKYGQILAGSAKKSLDEIDIGELMNNPKKSKIKETLIKINQSFYNKNLQNVNDENIYNCLIIIEVGDINYKKNDDGIIDVTTDFIDCVKINAVLIKHFIDIADIKLPNKNQEPVKQATKSKYYENKSNYVKLIHSL